MRNDALFTAEQNKYNLFKYVINKKNYIFRATFTNPDGYYVSFQKDAIIDLKLTNNVYTPFMEGYIVV